MKVKLILMFTAVLLALYALLGQLKGAVEVLTNLNWSFVVFAFLGLVIYQLLNASIWADVLGSLRVNVDRLLVSRIWIESESMKWLPGGIWGYSSRIVSAKSLEISKTIVMTSMIWEIILTNTAWFLLVMSTFFSKSVSGHVMGKLREVQWFSVIHIVIFSLVLGGLCWFFRNKIRLIFNKVILLKNVRGVSVKHSLIVVCKYSLLSIFNISLLYITAIAVVGFSVDWLVIMAVGSLAWLVGFWAIGVPGGIGVREAVIILLLKDFMTVESAIAVAFLWRILQIGSEVAAVICSVVVGRIKTNKMKGRINEIIKTI